MHTTQTYALTTAPALDSYSALSGSNSGPEQNTQASKLDPTLLSYLTFCHKTLAGVLYDDN